MVAVRADGDYPRLGRLRSGQASPDMAEQIRSSGTPNDNSGQDNALKGNHHGATHLIEASTRLALSSPRVGLCDLRPCALITTGTFKM
jgi:hypothetical protein